MDAIRSIDRWTDREEIGGSTRAREEERLTRRLARFPSTQRRAIFRDSRDGHRAGEEVRARSFVVSRA